MATYSDNAIVLRNYKLGEADRIVSMFCEEHGRVRAVAKGARKTTSKFASRVEPPTHISLQLYAGKELDTVTQVETIDAFRQIRENLTTLSRAAVMLEAVEVTTPEREPHPEMYRLLLGALRTLAANDRSAVLAGFLWKLISLEGVHPELESCVNCGSGAPLVAFDLSRGGVLCTRCRGGGRPISGEELERLRAILGGQLGGLLNSPASRADDALVELGIVAVESHAERRLRSASMLNVAWLAERQ